MRGREGIRSVSVNGQSGRVEEMPIGGCRSNFRCILQIEWLHGGRREVRLEKCGEREKKEHVLTYLIRFRE